VRGIWLGIGKGAIVIIRENTSGNQGKVMELKIGQGKWTSQGIGKGH